MSRLLKYLAVTVAVAGAVFAGTGAASAAPSLPSIPSLPFSPSVPSIPSAPSFSSVTSGPPVSCVAPVLKAPAKSVAGAVQDPAGTLQKTAGCLSGKG